MAKPQKPQPAPAANGHDPAAAFLREVDEALRYDKLMSYWHNHKWLVVAAVLLLLLTVAGQQGYHAWKRHQQQAQATRWYAISAISAQTTRRAQLTAFMQTATGGYKALAALALAQMAPNTAEKRLAYMNIMEDTSQPQWLQSLARFNLALTMVGVEDDEARAHLEILAQESMQDTPLYPAALEQLTLIAQRRNDSAAARAYTEKLLAAPMLAPDMRARALQRLGLLSTLPH